MLMVLKCTSKTFTTCTDYELIGLYWDTKDNKELIHRDTWNQVVNVET